MSEDIYNMIDREQNAESDLPETETREDAPFDKEKWAAEKKAEREAVYERIDEATARISDDPVAFRDYLDVMARFPNYSVANALLILGQNPEASRLRDFDAWKAQGESVRKGASAIAILEPGDEYTRPDGSIGVSYNVKKVFDERQTSARHLEPRHPEIREALFALIHKPPVAIKTTDDPMQAESARYDHETQTIFVQRDLEPHTLFKALVGEMVHADLAGSSATYDRETQTDVAQYVEYVVAKRFGVDVSETMPTLSPQLDGESLQEVRGRLGRVRDTAKNITERMNKTLETSRMQESGSAPKAQRKEDRDDR